MKKRPKNSISVSTPPQISVPSTKDDRCIVDHQNPSVQCGNIDHEQMKDPSTPRREITRQKKISLYLFHERIVNDDAHPILMHVVGTAGAIYSSKPFLLGLPIKGNIWFRETLSEVMAGLGESYLSTMKALKNSQWPHYVVSFGCLPTNKERSDACHALKNQIKAFCSESGIEFSISAEVLLNNREILFCSNWDPTKDSEKNVSAKQKWINAQVRQLLRDRPASYQDRSGHLQKRVTPRTSNRPAFQSVRQYWDYDNPCPHCKYIYLRSIRPRDRVLCCRNGKILYGNNTELFSTLNKYPESMQEFMVNNMQHLSRNSAVYNRMLSVGSTFIDNQRGGTVEHIQGNHAVTINGEVRYYLSKRIEGNKGGINYFTYDGLDALMSHAQSINDNQSESSRRQHGTKVIVGFLQDLFNLLKANHTLCKELQWIGEQIENYQLTASSDKQFIAQPFDLEETLERVDKLKAYINKDSEFLEVAAFSADNACSNRLFYFKKKDGNGKMGRTMLQMYDDGVDGLMYPLFYTHNEPGYQHSRRKELRFNQYIIARVLQPEPTENWLLSQRVPTGIYSKCSNRFQFFTRAMQHYVVEGYSRAVDFRVAWVRNHQKTILGKKYKSTKFFDEDIDVEGIPSHDDDNQDEDIDHNEDEEGPPATRLRFDDMDVPSDAAVIDDDGEVLDPEREVFASTSKSFLADSVTGSPRHLESLALNALTIVSAKGPPTVFITLTCNPNWPEFHEALPEGMTAFDRPDVAVMVFHARLKAFIHNLKNGKYFGGKKKVYILRVIEYQHRGLPHAHIVCKLEDCGDSTDDKKAFIEQHVSARFPPKTPENEEYCRLIRQHMVHKCSSACLKADGKTCRRGYTERSVTSVDSFDDRGYPIYKRPTVADLRVVPHNRDILLDWDGHSNVEFCGKTYAILYLYKYLFKGNQKVSLTLNNIDDVLSDDEIKIWQRGRMICAMQAMWCFIGYQMYPASEPSVILVKAKSPQHVNQLLEDGQVCDLIVYFNRPQTEEFRNMKYADFYCNYNYARKNKVPKYASIEAGTLFQIFIPGIAGLTLYIYKLQHSQLARIGSVPFQAGEMFFIRLLLYNVPAYSFRHLRSYTDEISGERVQADTFQAAAVAQGLVRRVEVCKQMFDEELIGSDPYQYRLFFVNATTQGFPTLEFFNDELYWHKMCEDYYYGKANKNWEVAYNELLQELARLFKVQEGKLMKDYGLPDSKPTETELQLERVKYPIEHQKQLAQTLKNSFPITDEMNELFNAINQALIDDEGTFIGVLQGRAGSGKSTFAKYLAAHCRSLGKLCLGCASTGLAASVYDDFSTAHSLFAIPVIEDPEEYDQEEDIQCKLHLPAYKERLQLLNHTKLIIWDEVSSQHIKDILAVYRALDSFKKKVVLFIGDALQITPVIKYGSKFDICNASIYCCGSTHFPTMKIFKFSKNLRLQLGETDPKQVEYIKLLDQVSSNDYTVSDSASKNVTVLIDHEQEFPDSSEGISNTKLIALPSSIRRLKTEEEVLQFAFPNGFDCSTIHHSCILATTNEQVESWNSKVQQLNPNTNHELLSYDSLEMVDDPHGYIQRMITDDVMNSTNDPGNVPPHKLTLKVDDVCILMRAVNKDDKFATNARVKVLRITSNSVRVCLVHNPSKIVILPRFIFKIKLSIGKGYEMIRRQFPLRLAYSMSINKSQGQTYQKCPVDLTRHAFSHGHLNVALSRISDPANIAIYVGDEDYDELNERIFTSNVVYNEIKQCLQ